MSERKAPTPCPPGTIKPDPPPAPPERTTIVTGHCEPRQVIMVGEPVKELELHLNAPALQTTLMVGTQPVVIEKLYGPAVFRDVRVTPQIQGDRWEWVIEQEVSDHPRGLESHWQEVARFDCIHDDDKSECPED